MVVGKIGNGQRYMDTMTQWTIWTLDGLWTLLVGTNGVAKSIHTADVMM